MRLEFLGDSILGMVTADFLYRRYPDLPEGKMTKTRAELVCEASLHKTALALGLGSYMRLGRGEEHTGGRERPSILADMVESIIAAIFLDSGMDEARRFVMEKVLKDAELSEEHRIADYKTRLQELVQRKSLAKVDKKILALGGLFVVTGILYVLFEKVVINCRPILMEGETVPEASFPSSHTVLAVVIFGSIAMISPDSSSIKSLMFSI